MLGICDSFTGASETLGTPLTATDIATGVTVTVPSNVMGVDFAYETAGVLGCQTHTPQTSGQTKQNQFCANGAGSTTDMMTSTRTTTGTMNWDVDGTSGPFQMAIPISPAGAAPPVRHKGIVLQ
jgi:hypothetical protein